MRPGPAWAHRRSSAFIGGPFAFFSSDDARQQGAIDLEAIQRYINMWYSVSLDLFGGEISSNAANFFAAGLKGRDRESAYADHAALDSYCPILGEGSPWRSRLSMLLQTHSPVKRAAHAGAPDPLHFYNARDKIACGMPVPTAIDLPQGTLHLLILRAIALEPMHGWAISQRIQQVTHDVVQIPQGSLYPALHRLERRGWIAASWSASANNRRAKYYRLTAAGKRNLERETSDWQILAQAVARVLKTC